MMLKEEFEIVMKDEYAARAKRSKMNALRDRIHQSEFYLSNMQDQIRADRLALKLLQEEV